MRLVKAELYGNMLHLLQQMSLTVSSQDGNFRLGLYIKSSQPLK